MSEPSLRACVLAAANAVEASRDELTRLDSAAGDGDHGVTMTLAARAVRKTLEDAPGVTGEPLVTRLAIAVGSVGGAIGPIYATSLLAIAANMRAEPVDSSTVELLATCAAAAEAAIAALGGARPGDKTILDALDPAVGSLKRAGESGTPVAKALRDAARSAREGATASANMVAAVGRASRLAERSRGSADPGASSLALILEAIAQAHGA